jgi:hypothetical protein
MTARERAVAANVALLGGYDSDLLWIKLPVDLAFWYGVMMGITAKAIAMHSIMVLIPSLIECSHTGLWW